MARRLCGEDNYPPPLLAGAGFGLPGASRAFPREPLSDEAWATVLSGAHANRLTGLLRAAVDQDALPATEAQTRQVRAAHRSVIVRVLSLERQLIAVIDRLASSGIETRVLKGSAVAHLDYPQPALRSFIDLDILVRPTDIDRAVRVLVGARFVRTLAEPRPGFDRRFDKGTTLVSPDRYELDLHRTFVLGPWGALVDLDGLWDRGQEFTVGGRAVRALSRPNRLLHACYHATLGDWPLRLGSLRDVAEMLRHVDQGDLGQDDEALIGFASEWGVEAVVAAAVADTHRLLDIAPGGELGRWAQCYVPSWREESWLAPPHPHREDVHRAGAGHAARPSAVPRQGGHTCAPWSCQTSGTRRGSTHLWARLRYGVQKARRGRSPRRGTEPEASVE